MWTATNILTLIAITAPQCIAIIVYFVRLETKIVKIQTDITWMNKRCNQCLQISENQQL